MSDVPTTGVSIDNGVMAMTDEDGVVITLYQSNEEHGADIRHDGAWIPLTDPETIADLAFVGVQDSAVALYDEHEAAENLLPIKFYTPSAEGPYWTEAVPLSDEETVDDEDDVEAAEGETATEEVSETDEDEADEALAASVGLNSAEDLDLAISAALRDPDLRWYVERRMSALGLEADLPWQRN